MTFDVPTAISFIMLIAAFTTLRLGRRNQTTWRSSYAVLFLAVMHIGFLYQFFGSQFGRFDSESWAAITAAAIAGIAADDDADAVGLLLVALGTVQVLLLAGLLNLRATTG